MVMNVLKLEYNNLVLKISWYVSYSIIVLIDHILTIEYFMYIYGFVQKKNDNQEIKYISFLKTQHSVRA